MRLEILNKLNAKKTSANCISDENTDVIVLNLTMLALWVACINDATQIYIK